MKRNRWVLLAILVVALGVRSIGLFHGLEGGVSFHPDASKQVIAAQNYLNGTYLWYVGALTYDGYPFGLNHVDEWLLRGTWPIARLIGKVLLPGMDLPPLPSKITLHYILRVFRVIYSLCAWGLFAWALRRFKLPPLQDTLWLLLAALSPIASIVTHAATGDVGPDLFVMLAIAFLLHARTTPPRATLFAACGVALGCAFSTKYHGILAGLVPGFFLLLAPSTWRSRLRLGASLLAGTIAGFVLLTPHVLLAPKKTLALIWQNFVFIKNYHVDPAFLKLPVLERWITSWQNNIPVVVGVFGILISALAVLALGLAVRRFRSRQNAEAAWDLALIAMPFVAIAAALTGKPELQPFHFSWFVLPVLLGCALIPTLCKNRFLNAVLPLLLLGNLVVYVIEQRYDAYYWIRNDTLDISTQMECELTRASDNAKSSPLAIIATEAANETVFRNRPQNVTLAGADEWVSHPQDALPSTPWPFGTDWVFADLPAFPRESRLLVVEADHVEHRVIISVDAKELPVTIYTGSRRADVRIICGKLRHTFSLYPFESHQLALPSSDAESFRIQGQSLQRHPVRITSRGAPVLVRFGADPTPSPDRQRVEQKLDHALFLSGVLHVQGNDLLRNRCLTPGVYAVEVNAPEDSPPITLIVTDSLITHKARSLHLPLAWTNGMWRAEWEQPRDLLFVNMGLSVKTAPDSWPLSWRIRPIAALPMSDAGKRNREWHPMFSFDHGRWTLGNIDIPTRAVSGEPFSISLQLDSDLEAMGYIRGCVAFFHLLDEHGKQVFQHNIPLIEIPPAHSGLDIRRELGLLDVAPGTYEMRIGIYTPNTKKRLRPDAASAGRDKRVSLGFIEVE